MLAFWSPAGLFMGIFYACQIYFLAWRTSAAGQTTYASEDESCQGMIATCSSGVITLMLFSFGVLPGIVGTHYFLFRYHPKTLHSDFFLVGDPTRPDAPAPEVQLKVTSHGVKEVVVRRKREMSEKEKLQLKKKQIKQLSSKAETQMLKHFTMADVGDPDRLMTLREARQLKAAATNKEMRASAAAYLAKKKFKKEEKAMLDAIEEQRKAREGSLLNQLSTGGADDMEQKTRHRVIDDDDDRPDTAVNFNPWRSRIQAMQKKHSRKSAVLKASGSRDEFKVAAPTGNEQLEHMFKGKMMRKSRSAMSLQYQSFTKGDSGRPKSWRIGSYYADVNL